MSRAICSSCGLRSQRCQCGREASTAGNANGDDVERAPKLTRASLDYLPRWGQSPTHSLSPLLLAGNPFPGPKNLSLRGLRRLLLRLKRLDRKRRLERKFCCEEST
ncbi:unnamed protein product [Brassica rapa subsp. trilocularis]